MGSKMDFNYSLKWTASLLFSLLPLNHSFSSDIDSHINTFLSQLGYVCPCVFTLCV